MKKDILILRHSAAHLLAHAVVELFPGTKLTIGPATQEGFFYDFLPVKNFKEDDLARIQARMLELAHKDIPLEHAQISKEKARKLYTGNSFKLELIDQIPGDTVGLATQGDFYDLCKGGHVASTSALQHVRLLGISGSYWRADKNNTPLQRIHGVVFYTQEELLAFENQREQALLYDHRRLAKQLDLFSFHDEAVGFPFFHAKGKTVLRVMTDFLRQRLLTSGYQEIQTPLILQDILWKQSGHWDFYKDKMYFCNMEDVSYAVKPMNCPGSILIYKERPRSYRELPLRLAEFGLVHRYELSGVLHGLLRVRAFTIDDGHIYCTEDQMEEEILSTIQLIYQVLHKFGFTDIKVALSTKPDVAMGDDQLWQKATDALKNALARLQVVYALQEGEGAFYGPKIEFKFTDSMHREWQCGTIQVDFCQPENFDLHYISSGGTKVRPVMIHRAVYGSLERFFAILLEHYKGHLPFWIAPVQMRILTVTDAQKAYGQEVTDMLLQAGLRAEIDHSSEQLAAKIKTAQLAKIPWMLIIGKKEVEQRTVTVRHTDGRQEPHIPLEQLINRAHQEN